MDVFLIKDGVVDNCISADSEERALMFYPGHTCMERTVALEWVHIGASYDGVTFVNPPPAPVVKEPISKLEFLRRFTTEQRVAIRSSDNLIVKDALQLLDLADYVLVSDPDTLNLVGYLESLGFLNADDVARILE